MKKNHLLYILYSLLIVYLLMNTGVVSDDLVMMVRTKAKSFTDLLTEKGDFYFIDTPIEHYTHYVWYHFFDIFNAAAVNFFKTFYILAAFFMIARFFRIYLDPPLALLTSFIFLFFPSHDSTVYMFMIQYLTFSFALYLYAYYLAHNNRLTLAFLFALAASFLSYGTPPLALALCLLFILNRNFKKAAVMIVPNIIYTLYFLFVTAVCGLGSPRIIEKLSVVAAIKQYLLQVLTFVDATVGPSMWLKIYYSFSQLSFVSVAIGIMMIALLYKTIKDSRARYDPKIIITFTVLTLFAFLIFAVTGRYPQICFNLGNRVTIHGSLLLTYLIVLLPRPKIGRLVILGLLIFTVLGISDHWKEWNLHQQKVIAGMRDNADLKNYRDTRMVYFSGSQYSKYGPIGHIEFFSEAWVPTAALKLLFGREVYASSINRRFRYEDGYLTDTKHDVKIKVGEYINVYDSERDKLIKVPAASINSYIDSLPVDRRHWVQLIGNKYAKEIILKLMPRLQYSI